PVTGPGMQVELSEPGAPATAGNGRPGTTPQSQVAVLNDREIRAVANALWAAGAEAISINGLRLTPISTIRTAGEAILIDLQPINPPYTISAIGDRDGLQLAFAQSPIARQLKTLVAVDGIGFRFGGKSELKLPSVTVNQLRYAIRGIAPASAAPRTSPQPAASPPTHPAGASVSPSPTSTES
ncbi:MAG: DUF881 domain-containing protein, partial [Jatrophihabitantaceae bacterium]